MKYQPVMLAMAAMFFLVMEFKRMKERFRCFYCDGYFRRHEEDCPFGGSGL